MNRTSHAFSPRGIARALGRLALPILGLVALSAPVHADKGKVSGRPKVTSAGKTRAPVKVARPGSPTAKAPPRTDASSRLEIKRFDIKSVTGTRIAVEMGTYSRNRRMTSPTAIFFVEGNQRTELWRGQPTFAQTQGGFSSAATVDIRGRNAQRGELEVVVLDCEASAQCKRRVRLAGGDLVMEGQPEFRTGGRNRTLTLMVKNTGPNQATNCTAKLKVDGAVRGEQRVNALRLNEDQPVRFDYPNADQNKNAEVVLECGDLVSGNNKRRLSLR